MLQKLIQFISVNSLITICLLSSGCSEPRSKLEQILQRGEIIIAMHNGPASYYVDKDGETGLEYELATRFAIHLGLELSLIVAKNGAEVSELIKNGQADIAAGGISQVYQSDAHLLYGPGYQWVTRQIVYRTSYLRPGSLDDIYPDKLHFADGTVPLSILDKLHDETPLLSWVVHNDRGTGPASYYVDKDGETGLEYELATRFAIHLGLELSLIVAKNGAEVSELIKNGQADIAAGGISQVYQSDAHLLYGPGYQWVTRQIVYRTSYLRPGSLDDIYPDKLHFADGTVPLSILDKLHDEKPLLSWVVHNDKDNIELMELVEDGEIWFIELIAP